tara:strand:+ start:961 stop:1569 length:609 start_codon:yes stop_codon:yes gene_type:complete
MPIILEVNEYDSDNDLSSTEDDNTNLTNIENKRKKNVKKSKKVKFKKTPLKESKIVKDTAKKEIKNMEKQILTTKYEYSDKKIKKQEIKKETNEEIREFFTDAELADQFEELRKLEKNQKKLWKYSANSHVSIPETTKRGNLYKSNMPLIMSNSTMFLNTRKKQNNSRTQKLNSNSIVNTKMPIFTRGKIVSRGYSNIGKMW